MSSFTKSIVSGNDNMYIDYDGSNYTEDPPTVVRAGGFASSSSWFSAGLRFTSVTIPKGATIKSAYIYMTAYDTKTTTVVNTKLGCESADNAAAWSGLTGAAALIRLANHGTQVNWNGISSWTGDVEYQSPNIATCVQEITDRASWASGNALVVYWEDTAKASTSTAERRAFSYTSSIAKCPRLVITYSAIYPTEAITRVTQLVHRYSRGKRGGSGKDKYSLEVFFGGVNSDWSNSGVSGRPDISPQPAEIIPPPPLPAPVPTPPIGNVPTPPPGTTNFEDVGIYQPGVTITPFGLDVTSPELKQIINERSGYTPPEKLTGIVPPDPLIPTDITSYTYTQPIKTPSYLPGLEAINKARIAIENAKKAKKK